MCLSDGHIGLASGRVEHCADRILWQVIMANPCCCCCFIYSFGAVDMRQLCNFMDLEFSSDRSWPTDMLIIFRNVSPLCIVPLKHSAVVEGFFAVRLLAHLKSFASGFAQFLAERTVTLFISTSHSQLPSTTVTRSCSLLGWENRHCTVSWRHLSSVEHNSATMRPIHEIIDCIMQSCVDW
jgi:hypothetical protein